MNNPEDMRTGSRFEVNDDPILNQMMAEVAEIKSLLFNRISSGQVMGIPQAWNAPIWQQAFPQQSQTQAPPQEFGQQQLGYEPQAVERVLAENREIKAALARQQAWIDSQPIRKHISEGLAMYDKQPLTWRRIGRRAALAAGAIAFTALATPAIMSGPPFWTLAWFLPKTIAASAIAGLTAAAGVQTVRILQRVRDGSKMLREKYGNDVIIEGRSWTLRKMTGKGALLGISAAGLLLGGLFETVLPGASGTVGGAIRGVRDTVWDTSADAISSLWAKVFAR